MASRIIRKAPPELTLEDLRQALAQAAGALNSERDKLDVVRFARVYVGPVLVDPRNGSTSILVSYSDADPDVAEMIDKVLLGTSNYAECNRRWYGGRDPYCA